MITRKEQLLERLTGVHSSRRTYYGELKERVRETQLRNMQLQILNRLARSIGVDTRPEEILSTLEAGLRSVLEVRRLILYRLDQDEVAPMASLPAAGDGEGGPGPAGADEDTGPGRSPPGPANGGRLSAALDGPQEILDGHGVLLPLRAGEQTVGLLEIVTGPDGPLAGQDVDFLEQVAAHIAFGLQNSLLYTEVARARQVWEDTFAAVTDALFVLTEDMTVREANRSARDFLGSADPVGRKCHNLLFGRSEPCPDCPVVRAIRGGKPDYLQLRIGDRTMDAYAYPLAPGEGHLAEGDEGKDPVSAVVYAKDVTELVRSTRFVALGEMAAGVAHELNGPLTAVVGDAQLLLRDARRRKQEPSTVELLRDIENCGLRARGIIQNLLAFSQKEQFTFEPVDMNEIARHALSRVAYQIEKDAINVELDLADRPPMVMGHGTRLEQVVVNLLLNARDALSGSGERAIYISTGNLPTKEVSLAVTDTGVGIEQENLTRIFTPFFTTKPVGKGTGLGLSVSLGIAAAHGGRIDVESRHGEGATFTLILPARLADADDGEEEASA